MTRDESKLMGLWAGKVQDIDKIDFVNFCVAQLHLAKDTLRGEKECLRYIINWLEGRPLTKAEIEQFFASRKLQGISNSHCNKFLHFFRHLDKYLKDRDLGNLQCVNEMKSFPIIRGEIEILTKEQIFALINQRMVYGVYWGVDQNEYLNLVYGTIVQFFAETGCRFKEMRSLQVKDTNLPQRKVTFRETKNGETRDAFLQESLSKKLEKIIEGKKAEEYVFTNARRSPIQSQDYNQDLKRRAKATQIIPEWKELHTHIFRHTFITDLLTHGVPMPIVAALVGHKDIQSTNWYFSHLEKPMREAVTKLSWVRDNVDPAIILEQFKDNFKSYEFARDKRFDYEMREKGNSIEIKVKIK